MILIISNSDEVVGADKDFLDNFSIDELNEKFGSYIYEKEYKNESEIYEIESFNVSNYKILVFSKKKNAIIDFDNLLEVTPNDDNQINIVDSTYIKEAEAAEENNVINLDDLLQDKSKDEVDNNLIDLDSIINGDSNSEGTNLEEDSKINNGLDLINESEIKPLDLNFDELIDNDNKPVIDIGLSPQEEIKDIKIPKENVFELLKKKKEEKKSQERSLKINFNKSKEIKETKEEVSCVVELFNKTKEDIKKAVNEEFEKASKELSIDMETLESFFGDIITQLKTGKKSVYKALEESDYDKLNSFAQKLISSLLNLRMTNLAEIFITLDNMLVVHEDISIIKRLVEKIYENLDLFLEKEGDIFNEELVIDSNLSKKDRDVRLKLVKNLLESLKDSDFYTIKSKLTPMYTKVPLLQLQAIIDSSNANEAKEKISKLINLINKEGL